jgi:hypothetical protein
MVKFSPPALNISIVSFGERKKSFVGVGFGVGGKVVLVGRGVEVGRAVALGIGVKVGPNN